jgi:D-Tyr-tRNAtyr deacylase
MTGSTLGSNAGDSTNRSSTNVKYNTPAAVVSNQLTDGTQFIVITQTRQGEQPSIWSSGDPQQTQQMFRQVQSQVQVDSLQPAG